jgi:integrase/recombinase XerC
MARSPKPWWREDRQSWYVTIRGERHKLGPDQSEADRQFHELMARPFQAIIAPKTATDCLLVVEVFDKYLDWCKKHRAERTVEWYHDHIQDFINRKPAVARLPAKDIKPFHVVEWVDSHGDAWSNAYRRGGIIAIQRPFNWAEELGYIPANPIKKIAKPQPQRREQIVTPGEWVSIRDSYAEGDPFRDILEFGWESGCRPQEAKGIEPRHVDLDRHRIAFPPAEAKGKKRWRFIYLTPRAEAIVRRRLTTTKEGQIFCNEDGVPWTAQAMSCRFGRLKKHLGIKFAAYSIRHGFCQRKLEDGIDHLTVAALMGHADGKMVAAVYSHMNKAEAHLREALTKESASAEV